MKKITISLLLLLPFCTFAQDTLKIMHYNALYYGANTGFCNQNNNNISDKNNALGITIFYIKPDILTMNEVSPKEEMRDSLLNNALNINGIAYYRKTPSSNVAGSSISNAVFYNSEKIAFYNMHVIETAVRDINIYTFYHINLGLLQKDTLFFNCMVAHLKSGSTAADRVKRVEMFEKVTDWLSTQSRVDNYMLMGDFNLYNSNEESYQLITKTVAENIRFYDPIEQEGNWHDNADFSKYHTQSTHTEGSCHSTGGLDDRFDFILITNDLKSGTKRVKYIPDSYFAIGNEGNLLNKSLIDSNIENTYYSKELLQALYTFSDHLPVCLSLEINVPLSAESTFFNSKSDCCRNFSVENPVIKTLNFSMDCEFKQDFRLEVCDLNGRRIFSKKLSASAGKNHYKLELPNSIKTGFFIMTLHNKTGIQIRQKIALSLSKE